jgi:hypothetical protein
MTTLKLATEQRALFAEKVGDAANLGLDGLAIGQFLSDRPFSFTVGIHRGLDLSARPGDRDSRKSGPSFMTIALIMYALFALAVGVMALLIELGDRSARKPRKR